MNHLNFQACSFTNGNSALKIVLKEEPGISPRVSLKNRLKHTKTLRECHCGSSPRSSHSRKYILYESEPSREGEEAKDGGWGV